MIWNFFSLRQGSFVSGWRHRIVSSLVFAVLSPMDAWAAGRVLSVSVETVERAAQSVGGPSTHEMIRENRLDEMDVYALSPAAIHLRLPRMVPPALRQQALRAVDSFSGISGAFAVESSDGVSPDWTVFIHRAARDFGVAPELIVAVIQAESAFRPDVVSSKGARGLMQLMPATGEEMGLVDPFDPEANIRAGTRYLKAQLSRFPDIGEALAAYNAGPGNVMKYKGIPPFAETRDFVRRVLAFRDRRTGNSKQ
jgi:soluble lytic murein transglycosylase-like protein